MLRLEVKKAEPVAGSGVMVALRPPADVAERLAVPDGSPADELHVTLAYLGKTSDLPAAVEGALQVEIGGVAGTGELTGVLGGIAQFPAGDDGVPVWVPVDVPGLVELRQRIVTACEAAGAPPKADHGFTPHLTLGYDLDGVAPVEPIEVTFTDVWLVYGGQWTPYRLGGAPVETKAAPAPEVSAGPDPEVPDGRPVSPDEEDVPMEDDPDADPRAVSPDGATGYFSDQWGEMTAWFFDDGDSMTGYISTPQEVIRVDDIDEWAREVDEAGLERANPPAGGDDPPAADPTGEDPESSVGGEAATGGGTPPMQLGSGLFDFSDLEGKHMMGRHNQRRHGNRYGISAGKRVLRRGARAARRLANEAGPRSQPGSMPSARRDRTPSGPDPLRRTPSPPPPKARPRLVVEDDPDARKPFDPFKVRTVQDVWESDAEKASPDQLHVALWEAADRRKKAVAAGDTDEVEQIDLLMEELDDLHAKQVERVMTERREKEKADAYRKMMEREKSRRRSGSALEGSDMTEQEIIEELERAAMARRDQAAEELAGEFWSADTRDGMTAGTFHNPYDEVDLFAGRVPRDFMDRHASEEVMAWFERNGFPKSPRKAAGVLRDDTEENPEGSWESGRAKRRDDRMYR